MPKKKKMMFGEFLWRKQLVRKACVQEALKKQQTCMGHRRVGEILVRLGYIEKWKMLQAAAVHQGIKVALNLTPKHLQKLRGEWAKDDFSEVCRLYRVVPVAMRPYGYVCLATIHPRLDSQFIGNLERIGDCKVILVFVTQEILHELFEARYKKPLTVIEINSILGKAPHPFGILFE